MQNDKKSVDPKDEAKPASAAKRAGGIALALINPFSDLMVIYRKGVKPPLQKIREAHARINRGSIAESLTWAQAVAVAGKPVEHLRNTFKRVRAAWWFLMVVSGGLSLILLLMMLAANFSLPLITFVRASVALLVLVSVCSLAFTKALAATYRLWQLNKRRVSESERGSFKHFLAENRWCRQVLTLRDVD